MLAAMEPAAAMKLMVVVPIVKITQLYVRDAATLQIHRKRPPLPSSPATPLMPTASKQTLPGSSRISNILPERLAHVNEVVRL